MPDRQTDIYCTVEYDTTICRCKVISNFPVPLLKQYRYRYLLKVFSKELKIEKTAAGHNRG
jgi:hypothetical protein